MSAPSETLSPAIRYADGTCALRIKLIYSWDHGSIVPVSGSSGLKDYVKNDVWEIFQQQPEIERVVMVRANGPTFFLLRAKGAWFDISGKQVVRAEGL